MAHELGVFFATVNRWETGKRAPSPASKRRLEGLEARAEALVVAAADQGLRSPRLLVPPTPFIGWTVELGELDRLLQSSRVLTLTVPGDCGKARLAVELVGRSGRAQGEVTMVALDALSDPASVITTVSSALGLRDTAGVSAETQVLSHLAAGPRLLVLENCEQVVDAVARLVALAVAAAPTCKYWPPAVACSMSPPSGFGPSRLSNFRRSEQERPTSGAATPAGCLPIERSAAGPTLSSTLPTPPQWRGSVIFSTGLLVLEDASNKFDDALSAAGYDYSEIPGGASAGMSTADIRAASAHVVSYVKDKCGIDVLHQSGSSVPDTPTTAVDKTGANSATGDSGPERTPPPASC
jgi:hypothetical protein